MRTFICSLLCAFSQIAVSATASPSDVLDKLLTEKDLGVSQSVHIVRLSDDKTLYDRNADLTLVPASVTKVLTSATALTRFTPVHTFKTRFFVGSRQGQVVTGDLYVRGDGDPYLVSEQLWQVAADIKHLGISEIKGGIIIDNSLFDGPARNVTRVGSTKNSVHAYDAPVSAFGLNFNTYAVAISPGEKAGAPAFVNLDPYPLSNVQVINQVKTSSSAGKDLAVNRITSKNGDRITVTGTIGVGEPMAKVYRSVGDNTEASGILLKSFLNAAGVAVRGNVSEGRVPNSAKEVIVLNSYEMRKIVSGLNTFSNNFIADVLIKRLGAAFPRTGEADAPGQGTYENGVEVIKKFLREDVGIKTPFTLNDGSGLSETNKISSRQITQVLAYMEKRMEVFPEFFASLPATGWDGTMKKRFVKGDALDMRGLFRAKTGTLSQPVAVAGLAGYFRHPQHGLVAFSIIENGNIGKKQPSIGTLRDRQDLVLANLMTEL
jgi:D-alanyl-D-alanine carboxypeptidase/D-alanyl-D-alanine-endopeptidase (penicillin-binding protein 4)